jgi:hypothetical protein
MREALEDAKEEIKRVEHLFYVSLKYTRTVDMIRTMVERLISTFDYGMLSLLKYAKAKKKIKEIPPSPISKCELLGKIYEDIDIKQYTELYALLRKLTRMPYTKREEYRRHVTMISQVGDKKVETNIDILKEYYDKITDFLVLVGDTIRSKK